MTRHPVHSIPPALIAALVLGSVAAGLATLGMAAPAKDATDAVVAGAVLQARTLEQEFWNCDYLSTRRLLDPGTAGHCSAVTEELKKARFGDDFNAMQTWWEQNKSSQHALLAQAGSELSGRSNSGRFRKFGTGDVEGP